MALTCERLMRFDLMDPLGSNTEMFLKFLTLSHEIKALDTFMRDLPSFPSSTDKIIRNELTRVIGSTLAIEGTILEREEIEDSLSKADQDEPLKRKEQEAQNSRRVYEFIIEHVIDNHFNVVYSEGLIRQIHTLFTRDINYVSNTPGEYRNFAVSYGEPRRDCLCQTISDIQMTMQAFTEWLNTKDDESYIRSDPFVKAIMAHYYLTEIHPFGDGNGRTARALEALILYSNNVNDYCFWSLANFWSYHKDLYIYNLGQIRRTLDLIPFLLWGLEGYRDELKVMKDRVRTKVSKLMFRDYVQFLHRSGRRGNKVKISERMMVILDLLMSRGRIHMIKFLTLPEVLALYLNRANSTRTRDIQALVANNLIRIEDVNKDTFIEPNYKILDSVTYRA